RVISVEMAITIFSINFLIRYLFLFNNFKINGIADWLKNKFGEKKGFEFYQFLTAIMFFLSALNFTFLLNRTSLYNFEQIGNLKFILTLLGSIGIIIGFIINVWSAMLNGSFGIRGVFGIAWFPHSTPIDIFFELVPVFQLTSSTGLGIDAGIGIRYFFK
ncbi:MAG: hypothetical protein P8Z35_02355, partial [Ignavibacteriaceae bacterium]